MRKIIFSKHSNERAREFAIRTDIFEEEDHRLGVCKSACYPQGRAHIQRTGAWYGKLEQVYRDTPISMNRSVLTAEGLEPEYLEGISLEDQLDELLQRGEVKKCGARLLEYIALIRQAGSKEPFTVTEDFKRVFGDVLLPPGLTCAPVTDIDMVAANAIVTAEGFVHMDYEWTFDFPIPVNYVIYRIIMYYLLGNSSRTLLEGEELYEKAGLTAQETGEYEKMEENFQLYMQGNHMPLRLLYGDITPGCLELADSGEQRICGGRKAVGTKTRTGGCPQIQMCVDIVEETGDAIYLKGWAAGPGNDPVSLKLRDHRGQEMETETLEHFLRPPVNAACGITDEEYQAGFYLVSRKNGGHSGKEKYYTLMARAQDQESSQVIHTGKLRIKNSRVGRKLLSFRGGGPRHEILYITPYERGIFGETRRLRRGEQRYANYRKAMVLTRAEEKKQRSTMFPGNPLVSVIVPENIGLAECLGDTIDSLQNQTYRHFEICPTEADGGLSGAFEKASGEYQMILYPGDTLEPDALFEIVRAGEMQKEAGVIYGDQDTLEYSGKKYGDPLFKPDFSFYMLRSTNYISRCFAVRKNVLEKIGRVPHTGEAAWEYDYILRCCESSQQVKHIPRILYHQRRKSGETTEALGRELAGGREALLAHYKRHGIRGKIEWDSLPGIYRTRWEIKGNPMVSVIIPNMDHREDLEKCVCSIIEKTTYPNYEILVVENNSREKQTFGCYERLSSCYPQVNVISWDREFNYSAINNYAAEQAKGDYLLFLNNDTEVKNCGWMEEMLGLCQQPDVGVVGAKLYYPDGTIQHAGVIIGLNTVAGHIFVGEPGENPGYMSRTRMVQNMSAVTAACMMTSRKVFGEVGGFDEKLQVALNDVDYCLKVGKEGHQVLFTPYARLVHYESKSRGQEDTREKKERYQGELRYFHEKWPKILEKGDPFYNPNLSLTSWACAVRIP